MTKILSIIALASAFVFAASAQTNTPAGFFDQLQSYFTSFNTNLTWATTPIDAWSGLNYQNQINASAEVGASYDFGVSSNICIAPEAVVRNAGVAGTVVSEQGGIGLSVLKYDLKLTGYIDAGENNTLSSFYGEIGARAKKKFGNNSYAFIGISIDKYFAKGITQSFSPTITVGAGYAF